MATSSPEQQHHEFSAKISEDINCSVCLDILCKPQTLISCGHSFCKSCCSFTLCPHCRQPVEGFVASRQLENLIDTLVRVPNLLFCNDDDKQHFLLRMKKEEQKSLAEKVPDRNRKRRRQCDKPITTVNSRFRRDTRSNHHDRNGIATSTRAAFYDPLLAALPPPYDNLNLNRGLSVAMMAPGISSIRVSPTMTGNNTIGRRRSRSTTQTGINASDAICID
mmetsp:Transcript_37022/g.41257  ORF Transcript_37022/g.41257 Transcript_37022/m.41257 type:complete len:221 (-) Transcript_37022:96-758(-)